MYGSVSSDQDVIPDETVWTKLFERNRCQSTVDSNSGWFVLPRELAACAAGAAVVGEAAVRDRPASADRRARDWRHLLPHIGTG